MPAGSRLIVERWPAPYVVRAAGGYTLTPQEEQLLNSLTERINQTQLQEKDPEAEALLNRSLGSNPDAIYILAQTVLVQDIALSQAKAQVSQLQQQVQQARQPAHATSFLGRLLGEHAPVPPTQQPPPYQPVPQYGQPPYGQPSYNPPQYGQPQFQQTQYVPVGGPPSFLRGAMQTAAGVAAGALAFEGVESILHGFGGHGMGSGMMGGGPGGETIVNNYYDDKPGSQHDGMQGFDTGSSEHHGLGQFGDQGDQQFGGAGQDTVGGDGMTSDDQAGFDDSSLNDSGADDTSAMDDGGQDDGGAGFDGGGDFGGDSGGDLS